MADRNTCKTCRFLDQHGALMGRCRRYPPQVNVVTNLNHETDWSNDLPYVANDDWCGEWKSAEEMSDSAPTAEGSESA